MSLKVIVEREVSLVEARLGKERGSNASDGLNLVPGEVIRTIAEDVVFPIVVTFVSKVLATRWKEGRLKRSRGALKVEIRDSVPTKAPVVSLEIVRLETTAALMAEGVPEGLAHEVVNGVISRVSATLIPTGTTIQTD